MTQVIEKETYVPKETVLKTPTKRLGWVDYARGLAIILVVYRHTMVGLRRSGFHVPSFLYNIQEFLMNVRMPVFFVLSGIFLYSSLQKSKSKQVAVKKVKTLLYPYVLWAIVLITMQIFLSDYTNSNRTFKDYSYILLQPRELDHMWYLLALFNCSLLLIVLFKWMQRNPWLHLCLALVMHFTHFLFREYSFFSDIAYYYVFLTIGVMVSQPAKEFDKKPKELFIKFLIITIPIFVAGQLFWLHHIDNSYEPLKEIYLLPFLLIVLVACFMFYLTCRLLYSAGVAKWLNVVGKNALYVYILHLFVISSFRIAALKLFHISNVYALILGSLLLGITIPILVYKLATRWHLKFLFTLQDTQRK